MESNPTLSPRRIHRHRRCRCCRRRARADRFWVLTTPSPSRRSCPSRPPRYRRPAAVAQHARRVESPPAPADAPCPANVAFEQARTETLCHGEREVKGKACGECWRGVTEESCVTLLNILSRKRCHSVHRVQGLLGIILIPIICQGISVHRP